MAGSPAFFLPSVANHRLLNWLFALSDVLRRCLVPLLASLLSLVFLQLPQTAEFFRDLLLVCGSAPDNCSRKMGVQASATQFLMLEACTIVFSLAIWYAARVLVSYQASQIRDRQRHRLLLKRWVPRLIGLAPVTMVSVLALQHAARIWNQGDVLLGLFCTALLLITPLALHIRFRSAFSRRKALVGFGVGLFGILLATVPHTGPGNGLSWFVLLWGPAFVFYPVCAWQSLTAFCPRLVALVIAIIVTESAFIQVIRIAGSAASSWTWLWTVPIVMMTPAAYLIMVVFRRSFGWHRWFREPIARLGQGCGTRVSTSALLQRLAPRLPWGCVMLLLAAATMGCLLGLAVATDPVTWAALFFAPTAVILWLTVTLLLLLILLFVIPLELRFIIVATMLLGLFSGNVPPAPLHEMAVALPDDQCAEGGQCPPEKLIPKQYAAWQALHGGSSDTGPILLVAAAGGGARAAAHTSARLAAADARSCGIFGDRIFAISAVSGGALGAATYTAMRHDMADLQIKRHDCLTSKLRNELILPGGQNLLRLASRDHLSPTLLRALFRDLPLSLLPAALRGQSDRDVDYMSRAGTLTDSWARYYQAALDQERQQAGKQNTAPASSSLMNPGESAKQIALGAAPLMLFNATSVQDGRRVVMSSPLMCPQDGYCARHSGNLLADAIDSARFPLVSPARNRDVYGWDVWQKARMATQRSLVDGGYFDNSGVVTLNEVIDGLRDAGVDLSRIVVVLITSNPDEGEPLQAVEDYADSGVHALLQAPASAIINARDGRTELALQALTKRLGSENVIHWSLSEHSLDAVVPEVSAGQQKSADVLAFEKVHGDMGNERRLRDVPPLAWALSTDSAQFIWLRSNGAARAYTDPQYTKYAVERSLAQRLLDAYGEQ